MFLANCLSLIFFHTLIEFQKGINFLKTIFFIENKSSLSFALFSLNVIKKLAKIHLMQFRRVIYYN